MYADGRPFPPESEWIPHVFFREDMFYCINLPEGDDMNRHAECNPGTIRIEDIHGNVLWPEGTKH